MNLSPSLSHTHSQLICIWSLLSAPLPDGHQQRRVPPQVVVLSPSLTLSPLPYDHTTSGSTIYLSLSHKTVAWTLRSFPLFAIFFCPFTGWWKLGQETAGEVKATEQPKVRLSITSRSQSTADQEVIWAVGDGAVNQPYSQNLTSYWVCKRAALFQTVQTSKPLNLFRIWDEITPVRSNSQWEQIFELNKKQFDSAAKCIFHL